jgi:hypothetical protein
MCKPRFPGLKRRTVAKSRAAINRLARPHTFDGVVDPALERRCAGIDSRQRLVRTPFDDAELDRTLAVGGGYNQRAAVAIV